MKKYRLYRKITYYEYKDVEAESEDQALAHKYNPEFGWKITDAGYISDSLVSKDSKKERGKDIFDERDEKQNVKIMPPLRKRNVFNK